MKRQILIFFLLTIAACSGADMSRGYNFTDGNRVFASQLHTLVDSATILSGFYNDKTLSTLLDSDDIFLVYSADNSAFRKLTANTAILANTNLITLQVEDTAPATNDFLLSYDTSAGSLKKISLFTISNNITAPLLTAITATSNSIIGTITNTATNCAVLGTFYSLISSNQITDVSNKVGITAGEILLKNSAGSPYLAVSVAVTADVTSEGANGREDGSADSANQWFYTWVIYNGTTVAGFLSTNLVPTLPSGYTHKALVGAVRNNAAADFARFVQRGRDVGVTNQLLFTALTSVSASALQTISGTASKTVELSTIIPSIATKVNGYVGSTDTAKAYFVTLSSDANNVGELQLLSTPHSTAFEGYSASTAFELLLSVSQDFYWRAFTGQSIRMNISGYSL